MNRRNFLHKATLATTAAGIIPSLPPATAAPLDKVRLGFIGVGMRGRNHVEQAMYRPDVEINAICDIDPLAVNETLALLKKAGRKAPKVYSAGPRIF